MKIVFEKEYLEQLYTEGKEKSKKYRSNIQHRMSNIEVCFTQML